MSTRTMLTLAILATLAACDDKESRPACLDDLEERTRVLVEDDVGNWPAAPGEFEGLADAWDCTYSEQLCYRPENPASVGDTHESYRNAIQAINACVSQIE